MCERAYFDLRNSPSLLLGSVADDEAEQDKQSIGWDRFQSEDVLMICVLIFGVDPCFDLHFDELVEWGLLADRLGAVV